MTSDEYVENEGMPTGRVTRHVSRVTHLMLHRISLRVLPSLTLAATAEEVRKRKRLVMMVPGLVAFGIYRLAKLIVPLSDPWILLALSGALSLLTALVAYRVGRGLHWAALFRSDGSRRLLWISGWIGFVYGVQLSLLVLALLVLVGYDYLRHPDGPAMMAMIIACTAVARDAFEIGYVRRLEREGRPFLTLPDGRSLWALGRERPGHVWRWLGAGAVTGSIMALGAGLVESSPTRLWVTLSPVALGAAVICLCSYLEGRRGEWISSLLSTPWSELFKFLWWPGLAFASTYFLVLAGAVLFLVEPNALSPGAAVVTGSAVGMVMALYGFFLGHRRRAEDQMRVPLAPNLLRCPFVMGILGKHGPDSHASTLAAQGQALSKSTAREVGA